MGTRFRAAPVYLKTKKIGEITSGTYDHKSGDEAMIGTDGYLGHSDGSDMVSIQFETVTPVKGHELALKNVILNKEYVQVGIPIDGGFETWEGRMTNRSYKWDSKSGSCTGSFTVEGGRPQVV